MIQLVYITLSAGADVDDTAALICVLFHRQVWVAPVGRLLPLSLVNVLFSLLAVSFQVGAVMLQWRMPGKSRL